MEEAPREVTPLPLQAPTTKEKKYDRQLRLWAASGQRALEESHILLIVGGESGSNSSVAGAEALKNLVLPSIGSFTIADAAKVTEADLGVNFFLEVDSLGKSRAEEMKRLLEELNPDVSGHAISEHWEDWLRRPDSLRPFNFFIMCAPLPAEMLERLCTYATNESIPAILIHSVGFYSTFAVQIPPEFPIVETHPDPETIQDLRLLSPWSELLAEVDDQTADMDSLSDHDHGHIPYVVLLIHYLKQWKLNHNDQYPSTFKEKTEFREFVRSEARQTSSAGPEENYDEACAAVLKTIAPPSLGSSCREMFSLPPCQTENLTRDSSNFWIIANAIKKFHLDHGVLPLPGSLPDMKATSSVYVRLQNIYKSKARADVAELIATVRATEERLSRQSNQISAGEIEAFAKNASHIKVLHGVPLPQLRLDEIAKKNNPHMLEVGALDELGEPSLYPIFYYFALAQASSPSFSANLQKVNSSISNCKYPDSLTWPLHLEQEIENPSLLSQAMRSILTSQNRDSSVASNLLGAELHNISSLTGGMVAQEAIKLITRQYVPVDNVVVYDGVAGRVGVMKL